MVKSASANAGDGGFDPRVEKSPWRRRWQPITVFLPGESHGHRSPVGYRPRGQKELDMTERLNKTDCHMQAYVTMTKRRQR